MIRRRDLLVPGLLGLGAVVGLTGFASRKIAGSNAVQCADAELCGERQAQAALPRSGDPLWQTLRRCAVRYNGKTGLYSLEPTPEVKAMAGKVIRVRGFTLPLDGSDKTAHFLIGINTPVCFYHPPGDPNEVIEVSTDHPIDWTEKPATVEGTFGLMNNGEMGVFFRLTRARVV